MFSRKQHYKCPQVKRRGRKALSSAPFSRCWKHQKWRLTSGPPQELSKGQNALRLEPGPCPDSTVRTDRAAICSSMHPASPQRKLREVMPPGCPVLENHCNQDTASRARSVVKTTAWLAFVRHKTCLHLGT